MVFHNNDGAQLGSYNWVESGQSEENFTDGIYGMLQKSSCRTESGSFKFNTNENCEANSPNAKVNSISLKNKIKSRLSSIGL